MSWIFTIPAVLVFSDSKNWLLVTVLPYFGCSDNVSDLLGYFNISAVKRFDVSVLILSEILAHVSFQMHLLEFFNRSSIMLNLFCKQMPNLSKRINLFCSPLHERGIALIYAKCKLQTLPDLRRRFPSFSIQMNQLSTEISPR